MLAVGDRRDRSYAVGIAPRCDARHRAGYRQYRNGSSPEQTSRTVQAIDIMLDDLRERISETNTSTAEEFRALVATKDYHNFLIDRLSRLPQAVAFGIVDSTGQIQNSTRLWPTAKSRCLRIAIISRHISTTFRIACSSVGDRRIALTAPGACSSADVSMAGTANSWVSLMSASRPLFQRNFRFDRNAAQSEDHAGEPRRHVDCRTSGVSNIL